jgi:selenocysteine lyase/cysteine desulfurase
LEHAAPDRAGLGRPAWPPADAASESDYWALVRAQYPLTDDRVYLNAGGLGPAPFPVLDAMERTTMALQRVSETGRDRIEAARAPVAHFLGASASEIAFLRNATEGNSTIASGLELTAGDEVIFESHAHPGGAIPWMNRKKQDGVVIKLFEPDPGSAEENLRRIEALITRRTRAIQVSHVTAPTGIRFPVTRIAELARARDIWFHIDGAQSAGMIPVHLHDIGCDSYATSGHKWMGAPHGTGLLFVRKDRLDEITPTDVGAYTDAAYDLPDVYTYHPTARRYESGTRDAASVVGLQAAAAFMTQIGMERVEKRSQQLAFRLRDALDQLSGVEVLTPSDPALAAAITTFRAHQVAYDALYRTLSDRGFRCRIVREQNLNAVRISPHVYNSEAECDRAIEVVAEAIDQA